MKKLLSVLVMLVGMQSAFGTSLLGKTLEFRTVPKPGVAGGQSHELSVYANGVVVHSTYQAVLHGTKHREVTRLSAYTMDRINRLVNRSTPVIRFREVSHARCFAPAMFTELYTADNGRVFLREGAICDNGYDVNARPAARRLVQVLKALESAAHQNLSAAQAEQAVEAQLSLF